MSTKTNQTTADPESLTLYERRLIAELLQQEWEVCETARRPHSIGSEGLVLRQERIERTLRKLGYLG